MDWQGKIQKKKQKMIDSPLSPYLLRTHLTATSQRAWPEDNARWALPSVGFCFFLTHFWSLRCLQCNDITYLRRWVPLTLFLFFLLFIFFHYFKFLLYVFLCFVRIFMFCTYYMNIFIFNIHIIRGRWGAVGQRVTGSALYQLWLMIVIIVSD